MRIILLILLAVGLYFYLHDLKSPELLIKPEQGQLGPLKPLTLSLRDGGGLKSVRVVARQSGVETLLLEKRYSGESQAEESFTLEKSGIRDGAVEIVVEARDQSLFPFGNGNAVRRNLSFVVDSQPPTIELLTNGNKLWQGGATTLAYKLSEAAEKTGVEANGLFFPGYRQASGVYLCVIAFPVEILPVAYKPKLIAIDQAGNEQRVSTGLQLLGRPFPTAKIPVSDAFLAKKTEEFHQTVPDANGIELFLRMNRDVRTENRKKLGELALQSAATPLWSEPMLRMARAKTTGDYAEARDYFYNGRLVDHQTHLGTDLASVAQAPILAANPGKVVFSGYFGIYGGCIVIDHGLGVQTLYGHLSATEAEVGETVTRGQQIGRSGKTGMAAGDHLHFEVMVSGVPVRPEEWMDRAWIDSYILAALAAR